MRNRDVTMKVTLDTVFKEAAERGFRLCNLFQLEEGVFRCNWIAGGVGRGFGQSPDPAIAAALALKNAVEATAEDDDEDLIG